MVAGGEAAGEIMVGAILPLYTATNKSQVCHPDRKFPLSQWFSSHPSQIRTLTYAADARHPHGHLPPLLLPPSSLPGPIATLTQNAMLLSSPLVTLPEPPLRLAQQRAR